MKKRISFLLALVLCLCSALAFAVVPGEMSVLRKEEGFYLNFTGLSTTERHTLSAEAGELLYISEALSAGTVSIKILAEDGSVVYTNDDGGLQNITIGKTGSYQVEVTGIDAYGSVWISKGTAPSGNESAMPERRQLAKSPLGYTMEYNPDLFAYAEEDGADEYVLIGDDVTSLYVTWTDSPMDDVAQSVSDQLRALSSPGVLVELSPRTIDGRNARMFRLTAADRDKDLSLATYAVLDMYLIQVTPEITFSAIAEYSIPDTAGIGERMQKMVENMLFSY